MKRGIAVLLSLCALVAVGYFTASKWAIKHETVTFYDASRDNRKVAVEVAVRRDKEFQADAGLITLPVAVLATTMLWASTIFPITPPELFAAAMSVGLRPSWLAVIFCKLPKSTLEEVSEPVRATPSQPSIAPKNG